MIIIYCGYHSRKSGTNKQSKFPNPGHYIEKYLVEKDLDLTATLHAEMAYSVADFVVIVTPMNVYSIKSVRNSQDMMTELFMGYELMAA